MRPELDAKTKTCLPAKTHFCHLDEQAINHIKGLEVTFRYIMYKAYY
jgi:hypothetical protein